MRWPVFVINLDRSEDRLAQIKSDFHLEDLIRISGVDGRGWESGEYNKKGMPEFKEGYLGALMDARVITKHGLELWDWIPCEVACALSHVKVWRRIIEDDIENAIVLEDDAMPTSKLNGTIQDCVIRDLGFPDDADVVFLFGEDGVNDIAVVDKNNRLKKGWSNLGYVITKQGAERAIKAQLPCEMPCDMQWWMRAFDGLDMFGNFSLAPIKKGYAYAMSEGLIKHHANAFDSTFTVTGKKPWKRLMY